MLRFCKDCANFEDRRDIDEATLCGKVQGPYVCCEEFEPRDESINENRLYHRFCSGCTNFEDIDGTPICAKNHTPGVACEEFVERLEKLNGIRQSNLMKTTLLMHAITVPINPKSIPEHLLEVAQKIEW